MVTEDYSEFSGVYCLRIEVSRSVTFDAFVHLDIAWEIGGDVISVLS